jgi:hypothetical protein
MNVSELLKHSNFKPKFAEKIKPSYKDQNINSSELTNSNCLILLFGIFVFMLVILGMKTIISHYWDSLSKLSRFIIAFIPLFIAQTLCGYAIFRKKDNVIWRECVGVFIFLAFGSAILMISKIYNFYNDLGDSVILCAFAILPFVYILKSSVTSLIYLLLIIPIFFYSSSLPVLSSLSNELNFSLFLFAILPYYYYLYRNKSDNIFLLIFNWVVPIYLVFFTFLLMNSDSRIYIISSLSLYSIFTYIGDTPYFKNNSIAYNSYKIIGGVNILIFVCFLSFQNVLDSVFIEKLKSSESILFSELFFTILFSSIFLILLFRDFLIKKIQNINCLYYLSLAIICFILFGLSNSILLVCINVVLFVYSIIKVIDGFINNNILRMNLGLTIVAVLASFRLIDYDIEFNIKGLCFVGLGLIVLGANYYLIEKIRYNE